MKKGLLKFSCMVGLVLLGTIFCFMVPVKAEENVQDEAIKAITSISISPTNKILNLEPGQVYEDSFNVTNNGGELMRFEVYAAPYSYTFSEADDKYTLGFSQENNYTQIVRWFAFRDSNGTFVTRPEFSVEPGESVNVVYRIVTPESIPNGGQYAVIFAHTLSSTTASSGVKTEASPGLVVYGRGSGETINAAEISELKISQTLDNGKEAKNIINATAKVKNTGNVDFMAHGKLKVEGIFGGVIYETPATRGMVSVIPEVELTVADQLEDSPYFGIFNVTWTVEAAGETMTTTQTVLLLPAPIAVTAILLLTILVIWLMIMARKRKERRSRLAI